MQGGSVCVGPTYPHSCQEHHGDKALHGGFVQLDGWGSKLLHALLFTLLIFKKDFL